MNSSIRKNNVSSSTNTPKLVIKPFKNQPKIPDNFEEASWKKLENAIHAVFNKIPTEISKEELYQCVEGLCLHKLSNRLYTNLRVEVEAHIIKIIDYLKRLSISDQQSFLHSVDEIWRDFIDQVSTIRNIFLYLDRTYALVTTGVKSVWDLCLELVAYYLLLHIETIDRIVRALVSSIDSGRRGQFVDRDLIRRIVRMLMFLGLYSSRFEGPFLQDANQFFRIEGQQLAESASPSVFMQRIEFRLQESVQLVQSCLDPSTKNALLKVVDTQMLTPHVEFLVEKGLPAFLTELLSSYTTTSTVIGTTIVSDPSISSGIGTGINDSSSSSLLVTDTYGGEAMRSSSGISGGGSSGIVSNNNASSSPLNDLKRLFVLIERIKDRDTLKRSWAAFIRRHGLSIVSTLDPEREKSVIEELLHFYENIEMVLIKCFNAHDEFKLLTKNTFTEFINERQKKPAELLARYLDRKLRGEKGTSDTEVEATLDRCMKVFRFLQEKDTFEAFYRKLLSKRLLLGKSANFELEKAMISKLKAECGSNYTGKLEGMFQDIDLSRDVMLSYQQYVSGLDSVLVRKPATSTAAEFHAQVLTTGYWPSPVSGEADLLIPEELKQLQDHFNMFYVHKYQGRRLAWAHSLERCLLTAHFPKGKKELEVSYYQSLVLLCFNKTESLTLAELRAGTRLEEGELKRTLLSLACGLIGTRVLSKEPKGKDVMEGDSFSFNVDFTSKFYRIKINTIQLKETTEEVERTHEEVFRERQYQVDAAIVRTMKTRKTLPHATLMSELMTQLKFPARAVDLKKRIETLIEREYIARDTNDPSLYIYLA